LDSRKFEEKQGEETLPCQVLVFSHEEVTRETLSLSHQRTTLHNHTTLLNSVI
jgi:hypothetical protein